MNQLWRIGPHRLAQGDCHDPAVVSDVLNACTPGVTVIDPPFDYGDRWIVHLRDPCIVFGQARHIRLIPSALWRFERVILKSRGHRCATTHIFHRHALVAQCGSRRRLPVDPRTWPSVVQSPVGLYHRHEKPLRILMEHLALWTPDWDIVFDPYAGSGATFVAAELLGRACYGIEIDRRRCLGIVRRLRAVIAAAAI